MCGDAVGGESMHWGGSLSAIDVSSSLCPRENLSVCSPEPEDEPLCSSNN